MLLFMYNTGARVQEVADVRRSWLSLHSPYKVQLLGKGRVTNPTHAVRPQLSPDLLAWLASL
jgi:hypothetical protein